VEDEDTDYSKTTYIVNNAYQEWVNLQVDPTVHSYRSDKVLRNAWSVQKAYK
jgi:hypothetical protein